ncbi:ABC transporter substrate-binding protein [Cohnella silvisoli]|uniref:ABC transporter substrate-binding protein n=1 Tax=Cohnella silvisoli TaxID=2873699 RepID=A0ABV1L521_9BACL|nr:ABC transporter substrate-binding protein [Cohnella silvisoli]MCD9026153.1 ABC transporter substrate-binding protein [Cohnella silvisoli]
MKKVFFKSALLLLAVILATVGCSNGKGNNADRSSPPAASPEPSATSGANTAVSEDNSKEPSPQKQEQVSLKLLLPGDKPQHYDEVMKVLNEKLTEKIQATLDIQYIPWDSYKDQILVKLAAGENFDFYYDGWWQNYAQVLSKGGALDISDLFEKNAPDLYNGLTAAYVDTNRYNGKIYGIPVPGPLEYPMAYIYRADIAEKYGYTPDMFKTKEDVQNFAFKVVGEDKSRIAKLNGEFTGNYQALAFLGMQREYIPSNDFNSPGMLLNNEPKVINQFETDYYKSVLTYANKGYNGGLIDKDSLFSKSTVTTDANTDAKTIGGIGNPSEGSLGDRTAAISKIEPGARFEQVLLEQGTKMVSSFKAGNFTVLSPSSNHPDRVLMLLNLIYADKDIRDTYLYGIEGQDFVAVGDNQYKYPDGLDRTKVFQNEWWMVTPWKNARIPATATDTDKASIAYITDTNNFVKSVIAGFEFNPDAVKSEISKVGAVVTEYRKVLESGAGTSAQLESRYAEFLAKLKKAGVDKIIAEKQRQIDEFLKK